MKPTDVNSSLSDDMPHINVTANVLLSQSSLVPLPYSHTEGLCIVLSPPGLTRGCTLTSSGVHLHEELRRSGCFLDIPWCGLELRILALCSLALSLQHKMSLTKSRLYCSRVRTYAKGSKTNLSTNSRASHICALCSSDRDLLLAATLIA